VKRVRLTQAVALTALLAALALPARAQAAPTVTDPNLEVRTVVSGLITPTSIAFLPDGSMLVLEKNTGQVKRVVNGVATTVLDLSVNNNSERGLLGIALHPHFPIDPGVYLYWSCRSTTPLDSDPFTPEERQCSDLAITGFPDSGNVLEVPLLGNRVDRFVWTGSTLTFDRNLIKLRAFQNDGGPDPPGQGDSAQPARANHNGGVIRFGPDGKLYVIMGDNGRRGQMQNLAAGPTPPTADDQFGGPAPDNAHLTGFILRLNDDGTTPADNPFFAAGAAMGGEAGANVQRLFAYGVRNSFGLAFDPKSGQLWDQQNADDAFDELNRVEAGQNGGWIQIMGPVNRIAQFKAIEQTLPPSGGVPGAQLQQIRWPPSNIADTPAQALERLVKLPGSHYSDPEFSWKFAVPPGGIGFVNGPALGPKYDGDLFVGAATPSTRGGHIFHFNLTGNRTKIAVDDPRLEDRVADNVAKNDLTESESLLFGENFGVTTDFQTGPNGSLFVVSLTQGTVYEIGRR
jgi:glucose/arabinose dehydrogenase